MALDTSLLPGSENGASLRIVHQNGAKESGSVEDAVSFLTDRFVSTKARGNLPLSINLDTLEQQAEKNGLSSEIIHEILTVVLKNKFPATVNKRLVKLLLPRDRVSIDTVTKALSWMCTGPDNFSLMVLLMRWLVLIHSYVDDKEQLHGLYDVIFYFLQSDLMCPHVCELLYHITRKEDVCLYRVQALLQLQHKKGSQPYLCGLLMVYKLYCPHLVSLTIRSARKNFFRTTDRLWAEKIRAVQRQRTESEQENGATFHPPPSKRARRSLPAVIPAVLPASRQPKEQLHRNGFVTQRRPLVPFAQIKSFKQLLRNLDRLELPGQLAAALRDRNLQHVLVCYPDPAIPLRITYWLDHSLNQEFFVNGAVDKDYCTELLDTLVHFTEFLQEAIPVCEQFLSVYLETWSGVAFRSQILNLVSRSRLHSFSELCDLMLEPLRKLFFCSDVYFKCEILETFTALLRNLVQVELPRFRHTKQAQVDIAISSQNELNRYSVFRDVFEEDFCPLETIQELIRLTDSMCSVGLEIEQNHALLSHAVFDFFDLVSGLCTAENIPVVEACSKGILYKQLFTNSPVSIARLCGLINRYRDSYLSLRKTGNDELEEEERSYRLTSLDQVTSVNSYIVNICDSLVRERAFISANSRSIFHVLGDDIAGFDKVKHGKSLSLYRHPALFCYTHKFMRQTQREGACIHPDQIKPHRQVFLKFLSQHGLGSISGFISAFIARDKRASSSESSHPRAVDSGQQNADGR